MPDRRMKDWAIREVGNPLWYKLVVWQFTFFQAYLVLKEREAAGVEPLTRDFIDPEKVLASLPSDEELRAAGVVINI